MQESLDKKKTELTLLFHDDSYIFFFIFINFL